MVSIEWINHAGFITKYRAIALACDPWLDGPAFNEGWTLIAPTCFKPQDFANVTHIWFSHEHPDHFSPKNICEIPAELRPKITVLFQKTKDGKVIKFCRDLGFRTVEFEAGMPYKLAPDFTVWCYRHANADREAAIDSFLLMQAGKTCLLNMNDYITEGSEELRAIKNRCGDLTVLFTQFSYANWVGNPGDDALKEKAAQQKIISIQEQTAILQPQFIVPFASFVFFSNVENFHMNSHVNAISDIYNLIKPTAVTPVVLYPGDEWRVGEEVNCTGALSRYAEDMHNALAAPPCFRVRNTPADQLIADAEKFCQKMFNAHPALILRYFIPSTTIWIRDYGRAFVFDYRWGLQEHAGVAECDCDISLVSGALSHCFTTLWGADTLAVNGCFTSPKAGRHMRFFSCLAPSRYANAGIRLDFTVTAWAIWRKVWAVTSKTLLDRCLRGIVPGAGVA